MTLQNHINHGYYIAIRELPERSFLISSPENKMEDIPEDSLSITLHDDHVIINGEDRLDVDKNGQIALMMLYSAMRAVEREMNDELIVAYNVNKEVLEKGLYNIECFTNSEKIENAKLVLSYLKEADMGVDKSNNYNLIKKFIEDKIYA